MRCDQIAYYCDNIAAELHVKRMLGLENRTWIQDQVTAKSFVWANKMPQVNVAELQFNYDLGVELEIIRYVEGDHWHNPFVSPHPFVSHVGIHLDDEEDFPKMEGCRLAQETFTVSHTSEYLTTGAGAGRKYQYRIFELAPSNYIKYIKRIHPK